jgi:hypothetical protein
MAVDDFGRGVQSEARLATPAGAGERHHPAVPEHGAQLRQRGLAAQEGG